MKAKELEKEAIAEELELKKAIIKKEINESLQRIAEREQEISELKKGHEDLLNMDIKKIIVMDSHRDEHKVSINYSFKLSKQLKEYLNIK